MRSGTVEREEIEVGCVAILPKLVESQRNWTIYYFGRLEILAFSLLTFD